MGVYKSAVCMYVFTLALAQWWREGGGNVLQECDSPSGVLKGFRVSWGLSRTNNTRSCRVGSAKPQSIQITSSVSWFPNC